MGEFNTLTSNVPLGNTAVANLNVFKNGVADDMATVQVVLKDNLGATLSDETYTSSDVSDTATDGGAITITNPAGTGTYKWTYAVPNDGTYTPTAAGITFSITVTVTDQSAEGSGTAVDTFTFKIVPSDLTVTLDTTAIKAVVKRKAGLLRDLVYVASGDDKTLTSGAYIISLGSSIAYEIDSAYKNGTSMTEGTDYDWNTYQPNVTIPSGSAPAQNDIYVFRVQDRLRNDALDDYITEAERYVLAKLKPYYGASAVGTHPTIANLVIDRCVGRIREDFTEGVALESARYRSGHDMKLEVEEMIRMLANGEMDVLDSSGTKVARSSGAIVGSFRHANGDIDNAQDLRERLAEYSQGYLTFYPYRDIDGSE